MEDRAAARPHPALPQQRIVWGALGASIVTIGGLVPMRVPPVGQDALLGTVLVVAALLYVVPAALLARRGAWPRRLVGLALLESGAVLGCAAWIAFGAAVFWAPVVASLLGWALAVPREPALGISPSRQGMQLPPAIG